MGMSAGGNDGLFKLAEAAAPAEDRLMPAERTYLKSGKTVSVEEAVALMKQRKKNPDMRIKGGLDDTSEAVRKNSAHALVSENATPIDGSSSDDGSSCLSQQELWPKDQEKKGDSRRRRFAGKSNSDLVNAISLLDGKINALSKLVSKAATCSADKPIRPSDQLQQFKSSLHKVVFMLGGMEFSVKCLNMVKDESAHTIVFVFQDDGDSFFTPPMQSELNVRYDGKAEPGTLYYFGMCFTVKALGLKFLGFLYDESSESKPESDNGNGIR